VDVFQSRGVGPVRPVKENERLIIVVDSSSDRANNLKEQIEFLDAPAVRIATPGNWKSRIGDGRLAAVFLNDSIPQTDIAALIENVGKLDPNVPIVLVDGERHA